MNPEFFYPFVGALYGIILAIMELVFVISLVLSKSHKDWPWSTSIQFASAVSTLAILIILFILPLILRLELDLGTLGLALGLFGIVATIFNNIENREANKKQIEEFLLRLEW